MSSSTRRRSLQLLCCGLALAQPGPVHAGSYEDFFLAVKQDNADLIKALLQRGFDPNTLDPQGQSALFLALKEPSLKVARLLIDWPKTQVETRSAQDESPLMLAAIKGYLDIAKALIDKDADVNKTGWAPLHYAASKGDVTMINLLLEHDAYIDAESPNGTTPLMMAAHYGTSSAVKTLLEAGADPTLKNHLQLSAIDFAHKASQLESAEIIGAFVRGRQPKGTW
jgi:ankyrin repeat protein